MKYLTIAATALALSAGAASAATVELKFEGAGWFANGVFASELNPFLGNFDQSVNPVSGRFVFDTDIPGTGTASGTWAGDSTGTQAFLGEVSFGSVSQTVQYSGSVSRIFLDNSDTSGFSGDSLWITISDNLGNIFAPSLQFQLGGPNYLGVGPSPVSLDVPTLRAFVDAFNADPIISVGGAGAPLRTNAHQLTQGFALDPMNTNFGSYQYVVTSLELNVLSQDPVAPVPVPASLPLLVAGLFGLSAIARRRKAT